MRQAGTSVDPRTVVILSDRGDWHAQAVAAALTRTGLARPLIVDTTLLATEGSLSVEPSSGGVRARWRSGGEAIDAQVAGLWWRRPGIIQLDALSPADREFAWQEWADAMDGFICAAAPIIINRPWAERQASRKSLQLQMAGTCGLEFPRTLITNDAEQAQAFFQELDGQVVVKAFRSPRNGFVETRRVQPEDFELKQHLQATPAIFQELVAGDSDLRVVGIGEHLFAARIRPKQQRVDFRLAAQSEMERFELDAQTAAGLRRMMREFGIAYCAADFRLRADGRPIFLELNPGGQYLFVEMGTGYPITDTLARALVGEG
jgi:glutathione synthase/RimK-type ligase-like ATP-grasp enzyme